MEKLSSKSLMVGDWVMVNDIEHTHPLQVAEIFKKCGAYYATLYWDGMPDNVNPETLTADVDKVLPIPLTAEILEKNGFEVTRNMSSSRNKDVWSLRVSKNKVFHIIEHHNKKLFPYFWIEIGSNSDIKYVHQLQHALRLCGISKEIEL